MPSSLNQPHTRGRGFSLIELIVTLLIAAILIGMAAPSFHTMAIKNLQADEVNSMVQHLHLARSLSVNNVAQYVLCPSSDGGGCSIGSDWSHGYILFEDLNRNESRDTNEALQAVHQPRDDMGMDIDSTSEHRSHVVYHRDGYPIGDNLTLTFCDPDDRIPPKAVILSNLGRVRVSDTRPDGTPLNCDG